MSLIERYDSLTLDQVHEFVAVGRDEDLQLEFKTVGRSDLSVAEDRKNFTVALSGFANSSGGIIVWGVVSRKAPGGGADGARELRPIDDIRRFVTRLNELTGEVVRPFVDGVRHRAIADGASGFAATLVPESDAGPHMAADNRYYKRSGDSFYKMEHFDLEDMFGRRRRPRLEISARLWPGGQSGGGGRNTQHGKLIITARNAGRTSAKSLFISLRVDGPYRLARHGLDGNGTESLVKLHGGDDPKRSKLAAPPHVVIHPGTELDVAAIDLELEIGAVAPDLKVGYEYAAEDVPLKEGALEYPGHMLLDALLGRGSRPIV